MVPQETASGVFTKTGLPNYNFTRSSFLNHDYTGIGLSLHIGESLQNLRTIYQYPRNNTAGAHSIATFPAWHYISILSSTDTTKSSCRIQSIPARCSDFTVSHTDTAWTDHRFQLCSPSTCCQATWGVHHPYGSPCLQSSGRRTQTGGGS